MQRGPYKQWRYSGAPPPERTAERIRGLARDEIRERERNSSLALSQSESRAALDFETEPESESANDDGRNGDRSDDDGSDDDDWSDDDGGYVTWNGFCQLSPNEIFLQSQPGPQRRGKSSSLCLEICPSLVGATTP